MYFVNKTITVPNPKEIVYARNCILTAYNSNSYKYVALTS